MDRSAVRELHYIAHVRNAWSILKLGILSHRRAEALAHESIAMHEIQDIRRHKAVPGGRPLHEYANLYFNARNTMLYKLRDRHEDLMVLRVAPQVLDLPNVVITDRNAASNYAAFESVVEGLARIDV